MNIYILTLLFLLGLSVYNNLSKSNESSYLFMGGNVGFVFGLVGLVASFFSAATLKGIPEAFAGHGIAVWLTICMPVILQASLLLPFGLWIRRRVSEIKDHSGGLIFNVQQLFKAS